MNRTERNLAHEPNSPPRWQLAMSLLLVCATASAQPTETPAGFGGIAVGDNYQEVSAQFQLQNMDGLATPWDTYQYECGYRSARLNAEKGELLLTFNDFVVTQLSYITPIKPDTDLLAVADLVMQNYGQPDRASMRSQFGKVTIDKDEVNFITLSYRSPRKVDFTISGRDLWEYRITVNFEKARWHENNTTRCAREKEKESAKAAASVPVEPEPAETSTQ